ncbi:hypothetical protein Tco_1430095 [Tanacetum coccineum]
MPRVRPSSASLLRVLKLRCDNRRCHNQLLVFDALDRRQIGDVLSMSSREIVYKFVSQDPENKEEDDIDILALDPQTLSSSLCVSTEWEVVFLGGTMLAEVILVKGHELPTIVKVLPIVTTSRYVVPTGRVKVPAGRYVVPTGKDNVIVSARRTKVIPAGSTILVLKEEYETWAMKMEYWIMNSDHNLWNIVLNGQQHEKDWKESKRNYSIDSTLLFFVKEHYAVPKRDKIKNYDPQQQITYVDFDQIRKLDFCGGNLDIKWQNAMLTLRMITAVSATGDATADVADDVYKKLCSTEFGPYGYLISGYNHEVQAYKSTKQTLEQQKAKLEKLNEKVKLEESNARFDKWKESSKNLVKLINSSMSLGGITVTVLRLETHSTGFASCVSSVKSSSSKTNEPLASAPSSVDFKTVSETADQQPSSTNDDSSFSFKENVKPPRNLCNKSGINSRSLCKRKSFGSKTCFVCGSKFHLIKDCDFYEKQLELHNKPMWNNVANIPSFVPKAASVPAGSRNRPTSVPAGSRNRPTSVPAGSRNRPTSVPAGRPFSAGWKNHAARPMTRPTSHYFQHFSRPENPHKNRDSGIIDSGCSRSMTGNKEKLDDFVKIVGGTMTFGYGDGKITRKGTIRTSKLNFENVYYVEELQNFNLFSVSQICDTKNKVLFTDKECLVLSKEFQLPENSQVVLRVPRRNNLYCFNLSDI